MDFEPTPGMLLKINGEDIEFTALDNSEYVYAETGREATVYRVLKGGEYYAFKVFNPAFQNEHLTKNSLKLAQFNTVTGLKVANRTVITEKAFPDLTRTYPSLRFAILMPWIQGALWGNLMANEHTLRKDKYIQISKLLMGVICNLESRGLAHCDLSNNNFIIDPALNSIELIDIESMYASDMPRPTSISSGTPGYRYPWAAKQGIWELGGDRFAAAILCAEIMTWSNPEIRENRAEESETFFTEEEIGSKSKRFKLMKEKLGQVDPSFSNLFENAWFSKSFEDCPPICQWKDAVESLPPARDPEIPRLAPTKMRVSHTILDFGVLEQPNKVLDLVVTNAGTSTLEGTISCEPWISASPDEFSISRGVSTRIVVSLKTNLPKPQGKYEFRTPSALVIDSNGGTEVIGATFIVPKKGMVSQPQAISLSGGARANPALQKKRGGCLTTWLVFVIIADCLAALSSLALIGDNSIMDGFGEFLLLLSIGQIVSAVGILNWKKWGVYGFVTCVLLSVLVGFSLGDSTMSFLQLLVQALLLYFLVKPAWQFMD